MKMDLFSLNLPTITLLAVAASLSVMNLAIFMIGSDSVYEQDLDQVFSKLNNRIIKLEQDKQKNILGVSDSSGQLVIPDDSKISELYNKIYALTIEVEKLKSLGSFSENMSNDYFYTDSEERRPSVKQKFEEESDMAEPHQELSLLQSSITDVFYKSQLDNVELVDVVCKTQSCSVNLNLSDVANPDVVFDKVLNSIDQDVDYQISEDNGEMNIIISLSGS